MLMMNIQKKFQIEVAEFGLEMDANDEHPKKQKVSN
jgi:hypothetical protein